MTTHAEESSDRLTCKFINHIEGTWTVDLADFADGTCTELDGTVSFAPGTKARFLNTQLLEGSERRSWKVLSAKGGIENPPEMEGTLPKGWIYRATEQGIRITKDIGITIVIR